MLPEDKIWEYLTSHSIATEAELELIANINGYNIEALNSVLYARTGYRNLEQLKELTG